MQNLFPYLCNYYAGRINNNLFIKGAKRLGRRLYSVMPAGSVGRMGQR